MMAGKLDAELLGLHAMELPLGASADGVGEWIADLQMVDIRAIEADTYAKLDAFFDGRGKEVRVRKLLGRGDAATEILAVAEREAVDFVAMPTRGLGAVEAFLFGSVTEQVLHRAACPVWTEGKLGGSVNGYEKVLCCVDLSAVSAQVIEWAALFAARFGAKLRVLHVGHGEDAMSELKRLTEGLQADCEVKGGEVEDVILDSIEKDGADLLVIGRGGRKRLIRNSPCAVFSVVG